MSRLFILAFFIVQIYAEDLPEGASCFDNDLVPGICRKANLCATFTLPKNIQRSEAKLCSSNDDTVVCCTDCHDADAVGEPEFTLNGLVRKTGGTRKSYDKCVDYAARLPYPCKDGVTAVPHKVYDEVNKCHTIEVHLEKGPPPTEKRVDFPSLALLGYVSKDFKATQWLCQGFIISERFIVSTAHCGDFHTGSLAFAAVGVDRRTNASATPASWQQHKVKRFIKHPEYRSPIKYNDIGLLETETEIKFGINVLPMCLSELTSDVETVQAGIWEVDRDNTKVQIQKLDSKECSDTFAPSRHLKDGVNFSTQACYRGFNETPTACIGSSGRPIYVSGELKCMEYAVGFVSFGYTCAAHDGATVYTRISAFLPWIDSVVWQ